MQVLPSAVFLPVSDRQIWVQPSPSSGDAVGNGAAAAGAAADSETDGAASRLELLWLSGQELQQVLGFGLHGGGFRIPKEATADAAGVVAASAADLELEPAPGMHCQR